MYIGANGSSPNPYCRYVASLHMIVPASSSKLSKRITRPQTTPVSGLSFSVSSAEASESTNSSASSMTKSRYWPRLCCTPSLDALERLFFSLVLTIRAPSIRSKRRNVSPDETLSITMISASLKEGSSSERKQARVSSALPNGIRMTETSGLSLFGKRTTALEESRARRKIR